MGFRDHLDCATGKNGHPLAKSTLRAMLATMREFILWLSQQNGFRSRIRAADADYFSLSRRDEAEARAAPQRPAPSIKRPRPPLPSCQGIHCYSCVTGRNLPFCA